MTRRDRRTTERPPARTATAVAGAVAVVGTLVGIGIAAYGRTLRSPFVGDDLEGILSGRRLGSDLGSSSHAATHLRPVTIGSLRLTDLAVGLHPTAFHAGNLAVHVLNAGLVAALAHALVGRCGGGRRRAGAIAVLAGAVFLLMPSHTEAVAWVSGRADLLATTGTLACLVAWCRASSWRSGWGLTALGAFAFGLGAKELAVVAPLLVVLVELVQVEEVEEVEGGAGPARSCARRRSVLAAVGRAGPFAVVLAGYLALRWARLGVLVGSYDSGTGRTGPIRAAFHLAALGFRSFLPGMAGRTWVALAVGLVLAVLALAVAAARGHRMEDGLPGREALASWPARLVATCLAGILVTVVPAAGFGASLTDTGGERLAYLSSAFGAIVVAVVLVALTRALPRVGPLVVVALLVAAAGATWSIDGRWADAGKVAGPVLHEGPQWAGPPRPIYLLGAPDTVGGTYVTRNALAAAAVLVHHSKPQLVSEVVDVAFASSADEVIVVPAGPRVWRMRLAAPGARFLPAPGGGLGWAVPGFAVVRVGPREVAVTIDAAIDLRTVWVVSGGKVRPLAG